ncbi:MAG: thiamine phosphate synthase [Candidatus Omnitrophota bacterium]
MSWSRKRLKTANLYLILDTNVLSYGALIKVLKPAVRLGVDIVQLRDKNGSARDVLDFCQKAKKIVAGQALFIVNDRVDLGILSGVDGVHLGQQDIPYSQARKLLGPRTIIGVSCQTLEQASTAQKQGADYIGFGSVFKTQTKPDRQPMDLELLKSVIKTIKIPIFPIGGISQKNLNQLTKLGVRRAAICRDILLATDLKEEIGSLKNILRG